MSYLLPLLGYLFGSISSAILVARAMRLQDPRNVGSGNPGTTNVLRYGGKRAAVFTLLGDVLKGVIPVLIARALTDDPIVIAATAFAAFIGHLFPVFFGFKGGKGVATALGGWIAVNVWLGLALIGTWIVVAAVTRYSSLSGLVAAVLAPAYVAALQHIGWFPPSPVYVVAMAATSVLLILRHRTNIQKLIAGQESKIGH